MRSLILATMFTVCAASASAQDDGEACHPISPSEQVVVTTTEGHGIRGLLLCLDERGIVVAEEGRVRRRPIGTIRRIDRPADPVWDGAAKGADVPLIIWAVLCRQCQAEPMLRATLAYSLVGLTFDALHRGPRTIYTGGGPSASLVWRVRF